MPQQSMSISEHKKLLVAQGALYRAGILVSRAEIAIATQPATLMKSVLSRLAAAIKSATLDNLRVGSALVGDVRKGNLGALSPLLITGFSLLAKPAMRKPLMVVAIVGGTIASATYLMNKIGARKNADAVEDPFNHIN